MAEKEELLEQLRVLGEQLAAAHAGVEAKAAAYEEATKESNATIERHRKDIREIEVFRDRITEAEKKALEEANAKHENTRAEILKVWALQEDLPKTIKAETWQMQKRVNKAVEVLDEALVLARLRELKAESMIKYSFDKPKLRTLIEADLIPKEAAVLKETPSLVFSLLEGGK